MADVRAGIESGQTTPIVLDHDHETHRHNEITGDGVVLARLLPAHAGASAIRPLSPSNPQNRA
jgi:hypothetical protein